VPVAQLSASTGLQSPVLWSQPFWHVEVPSVPFELHTFLIMSVWHEGVNVEGLQPSVCSSLLLSSLLSSPQALRQREAAQNANR
jgi:hypothetical protein